MCRGVFVKKWFLIILALIMLIFAFGCYSPSSGTVVDADTNAPIEGAVVMVEWTRTHGIGNYSTESYKVAVTQTDKDGKFTLPGCYRPFVYEPDVTIYKKGYVAWSSWWIFPDRRNRSDFKWGGNVFKLDVFKKEYSHDDHTSFISSSIHSSLSNNYELKKPIFRAIEWEETLAFQERMRKNKR
jgi:hypothetical protein